MVSINLKKVLSHGIKNKRMDIQYIYNVSHVLAVFMILWIYRLYMLGRRYNLSNLKMHILYVYLREILMGSYKHIQRCPCYIYNRYIRDADEINLYESKVITFAIYI